jgi:hypothetical protein
VIISIFFGLQKYKFFINLKTYEKIFSPETKKADPTEVGSAVYRLQFLATNGQLGLATHHLK